MGNGNFIVGWDKESDLTYRALAGMWRPDGVDIGRRWVTADEYPWYANVMGFKVFRDGKVAVLNVNTDGNVPLKTLNEIFERRTLIRVRDEFGHRDESLRQPDHMDIWAFHPLANKMARRGVDEGSYYTEIDLVGTATFISGGDLD